MEKLLGLILFIVLGLGFLTLLEILFEILEIIGKFIKFLSIELYEFLKNKK